MAGELRHPAGGSEDRLLGDVMDVMAGVGHQATAEAVEACGAR